VPQKVRYHGLNIAMGNSLIHWVVANAVSEIGWNKLLAVSYRNPLDSCR